MAFMPVMIVGAQLLMPVADGIPQVNVEQTCRAASSEKLAMNDRYDDCVKSERRVRDQLAKQWTTFDAGSRARCARTATAGHAESYIELLTCLELDRSAQKRPGHDGTTGIMFVTPEPPAERAPVTAPIGPPPIVQPRQQPAPAASASAVAPPPPPPAVSAPVLLPPASPPPPVSESERLQQSLCRSPLGYVLPSCNSQRSDARDQAPEVRVQAPDVRAQTPDLRVQTPDLRDQATDVRCRRSDARGRMPEIRCGRSDGAR